VLNILTDTEKKHIKTILRQIYGNELVLTFVKEKYYNFIKINIEEPTYQDILIQAVWNTKTDMENSKLLSDKNDHNKPNEFKRKALKFGFNTLISSVIKEGILEELHSSVLELDDSTRIELTKIFKDPAVQEALKELMKSLLTDENSALISAFMK